MPLCIGMGAYRPLPPPNFWGFLPESSVFCKLPLLDFRIGFLEYFRFCAGCGRKVLLRLRVTFMMTWVTMRREVDMTDTTMMKHRVKGVGG